MASPLIRDGSWVRQAFLVTKEEMANDPTHALVRTFDTNQIKFTDTRPGGSLCINPPPQFTKFADIRPDNGGRGPRGNASDGISPGGEGEYYSSVIEDNSQLIHLRFGVPSFNSLTTFFTGFYNGGAGRLARTGRAGGFFYKLGRVGGFVVPIIAWPLLAVGLIGAGLRFAMDKPASRFYNLKPTMPVYWNTVQTIVNHLAVKSGIVHRPFSQEQAKFSGDYEFTDEDKKRFHALLPDVFNESGSIDVFAMANRGQRLARQSHKRWIELGNAGYGNQELIKKIRAIHQEQLSDSSKRTWQEYLDQWTTTAQSSTTKTSTGGTGAESTDQSVEGNAGFLDFLQAELDDGAAFASFRVNATGTVSESFSNTVGESEIHSKFNNMSSQSRSTSFNLANGNIANVPFLNKITDSIKEFSSGFLDSIKASGLLALGGGAFVDIPQYWQSSTAQMNKTTYTMDLICPYNNPVSRLINIYVPIAMILAGALPRSTGKQSYTSPFICEVYDRGRCTSRLAIISDVSVTRGDGNTGWSQDGIYLRASLSFSVTDLSSVMHMPISEGFSMGQAAKEGAVIGGFFGGAAGAATAGVPGAAGGVVVGAAAGGAAGAALDVAEAAISDIGGLFDDENMFTDYMSTLASVGLADMIYPLRRLKRNMAQIMTKWEGFTSPARYASMVGDFLPSRFVAAFYKGTVK